ncbi:hypothetical protein N7510_003691 [Penicillium lagena]|uniref:uncharacterized protein n=1 Tax=Penicillium lagena TaxID=94218 RepID=UPI002540B12B|nr:uncharacterized protein N7510_003691 [Penicillium lagena]KAJ5619707.1 hypothetical protein N7510_003691 [Penicillium lagena]
MCIVLCDVLGLYVATKVNNAGKTLRALVKYVKEESLRPMMMFPRAFESNYMLRRINNSENARKLCIILQSVQYVLRSMSMSSWLGHLNNRYLLLLMTPRLVSLAIALSSL